MILDFSQNNIHMVFEVTNSHTVILKEFSFGSYQSDAVKDPYHRAIADIHVSGENPNDHHGAKHTGTSGSVALKYSSHKYDENEHGNKLEFYLTDNKINVTVHYQFYKDISAVRSWVTITNVSEKNIGLEYVSSFSYVGLENHAPRVYIPHNAWCREVNWKEYSLSDLGLDRTNGFSFKRIAEANTGTWSTKEYLPMGAISDTHGTMMWQIENNGSWQWEVSDVADMLYIKMGGPSEQENGWYKELKPNTSFESVKVCVAVGGSFDGALEEMTKYRRAIFRNNTPNSKMPVIFNDFMNCLSGDPTAEKLYPIIDRAAEVGAEYFCVDAGWYADGTWWDSVGEWQPCAWRFPNGIKEVFDHIRNKGMIPGIWLEIEVMGIFCPILDEFEDNCFFMRHGKKVIDHSRYQFDFSNQKVREYAMSVVDRVVGEYGVGYIKFDYNIDAGVGTEVDSDSYGDGLLRHNRAYLTWIDEVKAKYPDLILENCSSGGMRMDYAMLSKLHLQSMSDQENYRHTALIASNAATAVLPEQAAIWSYPLATGDQNEAGFNMVNALLLRMHLSGDIAHLSDEQIAAVKEGVECYKTYRSRISKSIPFYPLGLNTYVGGWVCAGYKSNHEKYIALWRLNAEESRISLPKDNGESVELVYPLKSKCALYATATETSFEVDLPDQYSAVVLKLS